MKYVRTYVDRHGKTRQYFRREGMKLIPLPGDPGTPQFMETYVLAMSIAAPSPARKASYIPDWLPSEAAGVYFAKAGNRVKIGYSSKVTHRLMDIQIGCPVPVDLVLVVPGTMNEERDLHRRFMRHRLHGEWFNYAPEIRKFVVDERTKQRQI